MFQSGSSGIAGFFCACSFTVLFLVQCSVDALQDSHAAYLRKFRIDVDLPKVPEDSSLQPATLPDFCNGLDCPAFTEVNKTKDYEERSYVASGWVSTYLEGKDYAEAGRTMFMRLFDYIQGKNVKKQKIAMTAPVLVSVIAGQGPACKSNFTMSFFLSPSLDQPPAPTEETVFFSSLPQQKVFVKSFGGFASESQWLKNALALATALKKDSQSFFEDYFYTAGYDSPFRILNRHNEVWYIAK